MPLIEVVANNTKLEKPGWVYVPDTGYDPTKAPLQPGARKRNTRVIDNSEAGLSARQSAALIKRIAELDKESSRDAAVPLPLGQRPRPKTASVRRIIESQRTFAHFLADEEALGQQEQELGIAKVRSNRQRLQSTVNEVKKLSLLTDSNSKAPSALINNADASASLSLQPQESRLSRVNALSAPSSALMDALCFVSASTWNDARAKPPALGSLVRHFCDLCGYWGRARCLQCGARLCGLQCKKAHDDGRCQKYGG